MAVKHLVKAFEDEGYFDTASQRHLFLEVVYWADRKGVIRVTQGDLSARTRMSPRLVSKEMLRLQEVGVLAKLGHGRYGLRLRSEESGNETPQADGANPRAQPSPAHDWCTVCLEMFEEPVDSESYAVLNMARGEDPRFVHITCLRDARRGKEEREW